MAAANGNEADETAALKRFTDCALECAKKEADS
jgi:hypothetical protein